MPATLDQRAETIRLLAPRRRRNGGLRRPGSGSPLRPRGDLFPLGRRAERGKIPLPAAIVAAITQANRTRRMSVYTIGIAPGPPGGPLDTFMKTLAEQDFGVYRRVDQ